MAKLCSITEAAAQLGVHRTTVWRACHAHGIGQTVGTATALTAGDMRRLKKLMSGKDGKFHLRAGK